MVNTDALVLEYIYIRDDEDVLDAKYKQDKAELKVKLSAVEQLLLEICKDNGVEGLKTAHGNVSRTIKERIWAADWDAMKDFIVEYDAVDLLEKRIHQGNFKEWRDAHPDVVAPVNIDRRYGVIVRRSKC